ncbi:MAG TPA: PhnD/SsuA/transferrin family substrate-binding protein [Aggregatilineales bacterium]|nr:PhnD/SsuA/transferrin family substrate-binding protein [Aggregatilineales bacterium]
MSKRHLVAIVLSTLSIFLQACSSATPTPATATKQTTNANPAAATMAPTTQATSSVAGKTLTIGEIASSPSATIPKFQPLADYLAASLADAGYTAGAVKIAPDFDTMIKWLKKDEIDLIFDSPYPAMIEVDQAGVKPILRRWKGGVAIYSTILFARTDSNIQSIGDLKGKMLALEEPTSTSGYMLPKAYLAAAGLQIVEKPSVDAPVASNEVGYIFVRPDNDVDIIQWVLSGKTPAGAVNSTTFNAFSADGKKTLVVLGETEAVPRHIAMVRSDLESSVVDSIKATLLKMDSTSAGQAILTQFEKTTKFDEFPDGAAAALARMRELYKLTQ